MQLNPHTLKEYNKELLQPHMVACMKACNVGDSTIITPEILIKLGPIMGENEIFNHPLCCSRLEYRTWIRAGAKAEIDKMNFKYHC